MQRPRSTGFDAHDVARDAAILGLRLARQTPPALRALTDQAVRAVCSVPLNLAEGAGRRGRDRVHHSRIAYGSALEGHSAIELLIATGTVDDQAAAEAVALLDRVAAMAWRLVHSAR